MPLIELTPAGLYCSKGGFYIDPWRPVDRAVITHGHADHARPGSYAYLATSDSLGILRARLGAALPMEGLRYGETRRIGDVILSMHPAGHILGSAQVRVEYHGEVWVVSGDYKLGPDSTCPAFEPVRCQVFISEATFALPIYRWRPQAEVFERINAWWHENSLAKRASVLYGYSLGKAQRLLAGVDHSIGPIYTHGAVERMTALYRLEWVVLPDTSHVQAARDSDWAGALIVAPPAMNGSAWLRRFGECSTAMASGWMQVRGHRRRRAVDRGFVLSDHADWDEILTAIRATGAETVWLTHGVGEPLLRWLRDSGLNASRIATEFEGDESPGSTEAEMLDASVQPPPEQRERVEVSTMAGLEYASGGRGVSGEHSTT